MAIFCEHRVPKLSGNDQLDVHFHTFYILYFLLVNGEPESTLTGPCDADGAETCSPNIISLRKAVHSQKHGVGAGEVIQIWIVDVCVQSVHTD